MKKICIFAGSASGDDESLVVRAEEIGGLVARRGFGMVFGAGNIGLMGAASRGALAAGGSVTGVVPEFLLATEAPHTDLTELIITPTMTERKDAMYGMSDAFLVLPGGLGTMEEFFEVLSHRYLALHDKPICVYNPGGFWRHLLAAIDDAAAAGFVRARPAPLFDIAGDMENIGLFLDKLARKG